MRQFNLSTVTNDCRCYYCTQHFCTSWCTFLSCFLRCRPLFYVHIARDRTCFFLFFLFQKSAKPSEIIQGARRCLNNYPASVEFDNALGKLVIYRTLATIAIHNSVSYCPGFISCKFLRSILLIFIFNEKQKGADGWI